MRRGKRGHGREERGRGKALKEGELKLWDIGGMDRAWNEGMEGGEVTGRCGRRSRGQKRTNTGGSDRKELIDREGRNI